MMDLVERRVESDAARVERVLDQHRISVRIVGGDTSAGAWVRFYLLIQQVISPSRMRDVRARLVRVLNATDVEIHRVDRHHWELTYSIRNEGPVEPDRSPTSSIIDVVTLDDIKRAWSDPFISLAGDLKRYPALDPRPTPDQLSHLIAQLFKRPVDQVALSSGTGRMARVRYSLKADRDPDIVLWLAVGPRASAFNIRMRSFQEARQAMRDDPTWERWRLRTRQRASEALPALAALSPTGPEADFALTWMRRIIDNGRALARPLTPYERRRAALSVWSA
jgi:hypothetical protein